LEERLHSRELLRTYAEALLGARPDYVFTHVTRMVLSKGVWRDIRVLEHLDDAFADRGLRGVFFVLSNAPHGGREAADVLRMEAEYGWPAAHRSGYPDLVGPEVDFWTSVNVYNRRAKAIQVVFVNQFGWDRESCGTRMPADMSFEDLRRGTDVEFGQSVYEPFGIAQLEPLCFGALCVVSNVCGCLGLVAHTSEAQDSSNVIVADYVHLPGPADLDAYTRLGASERDRLESERSMKVANEILGRLPGSDEERRKALDEGQRVAGALSWDRVCTDFFLPGLEGAEGGGSTGTKVQ
jgi:hypothetical protein